MSGYTRQAAADIVPTAVVKSAPLNTEYNQLRDAFAFDTTGTTGHHHDGTSDEGSYVPLIADVDGLNKFVVNTVQNRISSFIEVTGVAVEQVRFEDGVIYPVTTNDVNLGTGSLEFKDAFFDGIVKADNLLIDESAFISQNLTVIGNTILGTVPVGEEANDTLHLHAVVSTDIIPSIVSPVNLGAPGKNWTSLYVGSVEAAGNVNVGGNLTVQGTADFTNTQLVNVSDPLTAQHAATKSYVDTAITNLIGGAPGTLDTLNEIAASINDDEAVYATVVTALGTKLALAGGTMTGPLAMGANTITGLPTPVTGSEAATKTYVDAVLGSADDAAASATAAATAASSAVTAYDNFDDRYLGPKATAPTVDNDGDALTVGVLYFNTTSGFMFVYSATGFVLAGSSVNGTSSRQTYTATAGQTSFNITYDVGFVDLYMNGVKLLLGVDYTATDGATVVLVVGATVGDIVDMVAFGTFSVANVLAPANNLSDVASASVSRTNLGLAIGTDVQPYDATIVVDADIGVTVASYDSNLPTWPATVDSTEVGYLNGVSSNIQTQIDAKASTGKAIAMAMVFG
tara:strand:+ start:567 stop:2279 length:1713 start_codon:yes stop_codon:yes gene_type:complete